MAERDFETELERMFGQAPSYPDAAQFARRVETRLDRSWRWRTVGLGAAGIVGGLVAASQTLGAGLGLRLEQASTSSTRVADSLYRDFGAQLDMLGDVGSGMGLFWMVSGMMILAAVVIAGTKAFENI
jgi:hypothetical protein